MKDCKHQFWTRSRPRSYCMGCDKTAREIELEIELASVRLLAQQYEGLKGLEELCIAFARRRPGYGGAIEDWVLAKYPELMKEGL